VPRVLFLPYFLLGNRQPGAVFSFAAAPLPFFASERFKKSLSLGKTDPHVPTVFLQITAIFFFPPPPEAATVLSPRANLNAPAFGKARTRGCLSPSTGILKILAFSFRD